MSDVFEKKIMIIDDNNFSRQLLAIKLKKDGFKALHIPDTSVEAWEQIAHAQLSNDPFHLIITDLNMPDLDGMELISKIKEDELIKSLKVIVVSADADQIIQDITLNLGASAYLVKPVVPKEFIAVVKAVLNEQELTEVKGAFGA